ncbi:MAG: LptF/LptG family permease [Lentisphaeria bacterium]|nr:LptF/LptG family permease [Lentisphaeria bacterium]
MAGPDKELLKRYQDEQAKRTFVFLPTLDLYVLREFLIPFSVLIFAFLLLFLIGDIFNDLSDFLESKHATVGMAVKFFLLKMPQNIRFVLPISILLACMYTFANFGRNNEIAAMRSSGMSLLRCGLSMYIVGFLVMLVTFWFNEQVIPYTTLEAVYLKKKAEDPNYDARQYTMLQYRSADKMRDWLFQNFTSDGEHQDVILKRYIFSRDGSKLLDWDIRAKSARFENGKGWLFTNAVLTPYNHKLRLAGTPERHEKILIPQKEVPEQPEDIANAVKPPEELPAKVLIHMLGDNQTMVPTLRAMYLTYLYYRLAFPTVCFLCVFLALPLAAKNERSGVFLSIAFAVGIVVAYQVLTEIFMILGKSGIVPPIVGGLGPTVGFLIYSWFGIIRKAG